MTEPTSQPLRDVEEELDSILDGIAYRVRANDLLEARARLRRALMYTWSDGHSAAALAMSRQDPAEQNPWLKTDKS
jgi:hypothetical protein